MKKYLTAVILYAAFLSALVLPALADPTPSPKQEGAPSPGVTIDPNILPSTPSPSEAAHPWRAAPKVDMGAACPNTRSAAKTEVAAREAHAVASYDEERNLLKQAALAYFRCATMLANRRDVNGLYAHDRALFLYADTLQRSFPSAPDAAALAQLSSTVNGLATTTTFADVHDDALAVAKRLPAPPTPVPTVSPVDLASCRASGLADALSEWAATYTKYANAVQVTNQMGVQRANLFTQIAYASDIAAENKVIQQLREIESRMDSAVGAMRRARAVESATLARTIVDHAHEVGAYAEAFTASHHRGAASVSDRDHLQASRLAVDEAAQKLKALPYCSR